MRPALPLLWHKSILSRIARWQAGQTWSDKQRKGIVWSVVLVLCLLGWMASWPKLPLLWNSPLRPTKLTPQAAPPLVSSLPPVAPCQRDSLAQTKEIVMGALAPLSKPGAVQVGFAMQAAMKLAVEDVNATGGILGKPIHLITYDTAGLPDQGTRFANRLIREDCAAILVGEHHSDVAIAVKKVAHQFGIPVIFVDPRADEITADQAPEVFRVGATTSMLMQAPAKWLAEVGDYNHDDARVVVFVAENSTMGKDRVEWVKQGWPRYGLDVQTLLVDLPTQDFSPVIARIVAYDKLPDAIFIHLPSAPAFTLQRQLLDAGVGPQKKTLIINNASIVDEKNFWQQVPDGVYTIASRIGAWHSTVTTLGMKFAQAYSREFKLWPDPYAFEAYDTVHLAADAIARANSLQPAKIINALETTDLELASGHYTFPYGAKNRPDGERVPAYLWHQWPDSPMLFLQYGAADQKASNAVVIWPPIYRKIHSPLLPELNQAP